MKRINPAGAWGRGAALTIALGSVCAIARGESPAPPIAIGVSTDLGVALERTRSQGVPTVAIAPTPDGPDSRAFYRAVAESPWARETRGLVQIVESPAGAAVPSPSVTVYTAGPAGIACRGRKVGGSAAEAVAWLSTMDLAPARPVSDPSVVRVNQNGGLPSAQAVPQPMAPPVSAPPAPVQAPPVFAPAPAQPQMMMMVPQPAPSTTSVVQMPSQNIVVQPGETRFFMAAPSSAPTMAMVAQPQPSMMMAAPPPAPTPNLFLPVAAPPPSPPMMAAAPTAYVAAAPPPVAAAVPTGVAAVTNQTLSLPTSASRTRVRVRGPGPIRAGLASFGERLTRLGRSRIETIQETEFNTPISQAAGGLATFSTTSAAPIAAPPPQTILVPQAAAPPPSAPTYEYPAASPQSAPAKQGHFHKN